MLKMRITSWHQTPWKLQPPLRWAIGSWLSPAQRRSENLLLFWQQVSGGLWKAMAHLLFLVGKPGRRKWAQRGQETCPRSHGECMTDPG